MTYLAFVDACGPLDAPDDLVKAWGPRARRAAAEKRRRRRKPTPAQHADRVAMTFAGGVVGAGLGVLTGPDRADRSGRTTLSRAAAGAAGGGAVSYLGAVGAQRIGRDKKPQGRRVEKAWSNAARKAAAEKRRLRVRRETRSWQRAQRVMGEEDGFEAQRDRASEARMSGRPRRRAGHGRSKPPPASDDDILDVLADLGQDDRTIRARRTMRDIDRRTGVARSHAEMAADVDERIDRFDQKLQRGKYAVPPRKPFGKAWSDKARKAAAEKRRQRGKHQRRGAGRRSLLNEVRAVDDATPQQQRDFYRMRLRIRRDGRPTRPPLPRRHTEEDVLDAFFDMGEDPKKIKMRRSIRESDRYRGVRRHQSDVGAEADETLAEAERIGIDLFPDPNFDADFERGAGQKYTPRRRRTVKDYLGE